MIIGIKFCVSVNNIFQFSKGMFAEYVVLVTDKQMPVRMYIQGQ